MFVEFGLGKSWFAYLQQDDGADPGDDVYLDPDTGVAKSYILDLPPWLNLGLTGKEALDAQNKANDKSQKPESGATDRATNGLP